MPTITIRVTQYEMDLIEAHKAMLRARDWSDYFSLICDFPRYTDEFREPFESEPSERTRKISLVVADDVYEMADRVKRNSFRSWKEFLLEPAIQDGVLEILQQFQMVSKIVRNKGLNLWSEYVGVSI